MPTGKIKNIISNELKELKEKGTSKGKEQIISKVKKGKGKKGTRYLLKNKGNQEFIRMNCNSYLGMSLKKEIIAVKSNAADEYGVGPGAVRFINGTFKPHRDLEKKLADFHNREDGMIYNAAYSTVIGILPYLITKDTIVVSDELNHNCIINAIRLSKPKDKAIYEHNNMSELKKYIKKFIGKGKRLIIVTDGIFSMRGDHAPLNKIQELAEKYNEKFTEGIITIVDDSHGVGAFGKTGKGTEEYTNAKADLLVGTLGKAFGVNGGYVVSDKTIINYLKENSITYVYSNPITAAEAAAALAVVKFVDSTKGIKRIKTLRKLTQRFENGLKKLGFSIIESDHPIVPLIVGDTKKTSDIVNYLIKNGVLATGINYPVVPKGEEEIRFQINADHTKYDIDQVLNLLENYKDKYK